MPTGSSLWLSWTSALKRTSFFVFLRRGKNVCVLRRPWCTFLVLKISTYMESPTSTYAYCILYVYTYIDTHISSSDTYSMSNGVRIICISYVYTYIDTHRYVLYEQWCTTLYVSCMYNMYKYDNMKYVQTCTCSYVFCTYIRAKIRTNTFLMRNDVRVLYV